MSVSFNTVQQQAINEYRQANNLGYVLSDEAVVQEMIKNGKLPACFSAAAQPVNTEKPGNDGVAAPPASNNASTNTSIFGGGYTQDAVNTSTAAPTENTIADTKNQNAQSADQAPAKTPEEIAAEKRENELKTLGLQNNKGAGTKLKTANGKIYTVVGESSNGRRIVEDEEGNIQVISHDNKFLDKNYILRSNKADLIRSNPKTARDLTVSMLDEQINNAQKAFDNQMAEDGWAGDVADGVSILWGSENRASKVREDLEKYNENLAGLKDAAAKGNDEFKAAFKEMFGVDYDADSVAAYVKTPTDENYEKAFGAKNNIGQRVAKYNESQQTGAAAVKTTATVAAGVAIGVATGGAGLVAVGAAAAGTAAASAAINVSDRVSSDVGLKDGELTEIAKNAAWDGASVIAGGVVGKAAGTAIKGATTAARTARAAVNTAGDVAMGAAQEYAETGTVTASGTAMNAALGTVGIAAESGALKKAKNLITGNHPTPDAPSVSAHNSASQTPNTTPDVNTRADAPVQPQPEAAVNPKVEPEQVSNHSSSEVKPQTETKPDGENQSSPQTSQTPKKHNFVQDVMSNTKDSEAALNNADLSNPEVMKNYTDMFAEAFPAMKNYPRKGQIIKQYQDLINHPDYNNLSDANKTIAKMCILRNSDIYPEDIAKAFNVNKYTLKRMEDMASLVNAETNPKAVAALYNKGDYEAFKILNDVKPNRKVSTDAIAQMDNYHQTAQSNGNLLVKHSHITNPNDIPTKTITKNGNEYSVPVLDLTDDDVLANLDKYGFDKGTTADNLKLTVHMNNEFNKNPRVIGRLMNSNDVSYSASVTNGKTHLYDDMQVGILLDYKQGAVSYASNYAAGTGFGKNRTAFAHTKLGESANEHTTFIRDRFIDRMQQKGADINAEDYAKISEMFSGKHMTAAQLENIAEDGFVTINNKKFSIDDINEALDGSTDDLMNIRAEIREGVYFKKGFNEVNVYNGDIKALYIRANNADEQIEDIVSEDLLKWAQQKNIPIVFQRYNLAEG